MILERSRLKTEKSILEHQIGQSADRLLDIGRDAVSPTLERHQSALKKLGELIGAGGLEKFRGQLFDRGENALKLAELERRLREAGVSL